MIGRLAHHDVPTGAADQIVGDLRFPPPALPAGLVERAHLLRRLADRPEATVMVVSAPAGYGKTTLLAQWALGEDRPLAWLEAGAAHADPATFLEDLLGALGQVGVDLDPRLDDLPGLHGGHASMSVLPRLGRDVQRVREGFVLVVDDAGRLDQPHQREALDVIAQSLRPGSRLVLACRAEPPVRLAGLRAGRRLAELSQADLAMDADEARGLLEGLGMRVGEEELAVLLGRTEGWPAGLVVAGMGAREDHDAASAIARFTGGDRRIADYFAEEVLGQTPAEDVGLLARTSVLEVLTADSCTAVMGEPVGVADLRRLAASNRFIVQLDPRAERFRHHHLLADALRAELARREPELLPRLHGRAARWWAGQGDHLRAVHHLLEAGMVDEAADLVWRCVPLLQPSGRLPTLRQMLRLFPDEEMRRRAPLALAMAYSCIDDSGHLVGHWARVAEAAGWEGPLPGGPANLEAAVAMLRAIIGREGIAGTARDAARAYELDEAGSPWRSLAAYLMGVAAHLQGDAPRAHEMLRESAERAGTAMPSIFMLCRSWMAVIRVLEGDWSGAESSAARAEEAVRQAGLDPYMTTAVLRALQALFAAHDRDADTARERIQQSRMRLLPSADIGPWFGLMSRILMARAAMQVREHATARTLMREAAELRDRVPDSPVLDREFRETLAAIEGLGPAMGAGPGTLTTAELRVLGYLPTHLTFREIGERLHLSRFTVKSQALAAYRKLGVASRSEAVGRARALGLIDAEH